MLLFIAYQTRKIHHRSIQDSFINHFQYASRARGIAQRYVYSTRYEKLTKHRDVDLQSVKFGHINGKKIKLFNWPIGVREGTAVRQQFGVKAASLLCSQITSR
jgi:hypothetical protein